MPIIIFENRNYRIRPVEISEVGTRIIASKALEKALFSKEGQYKSEVARYIDEQIYFFVENSELRLKESELTKYIKKYCV